MRCLQSVVVLVFAFVMLNARAVSGDIIYSIEDYPAFQNGHSLAGTIVTTDTAPDDGLLMSAEIVDWSFTVTGASGFSLSNTGSSPDEVTGNINISPTEITIGFPADGETNQFELADTLGNPFLRYLWVNDINAQGVFEQYEASESNGNEAWQSFPGPSGLGGGQSWVIATAVAVPEPSPLLLLAALAVPMIVRRRLR